MVDYVYVTHRMMEFLEANNDKKGLEFLRDLIQEEEWKMEVLEQEYQEKLLMEEEEEKERQKMSNYVHVEEYRGYYLDRYNPNTGEVIE